MSKTETEKLAATANGCLQVVAVVLVLLFAGCVVGPCTVPLLVAAGLSEPPAAPTEAPATGPQQPAGAR